MNFAQKIIYSIDEKTQLFQYVEIKRALWFENFFPIDNWIYKNDRILDVGSGVGDITRVLAKHTKNILVGIDIDDFRRRGNKKIKEFCFTIGDANKLPFKDNYFDCITVFWTLHHITNPLDTLHELHRVCKPSSQIIIIEDLVDNSQSLKGFFTRVYDSLINLEFGKHPHSNYSLNGWMDLLKNSFSIQFLETREVPWFTNLKLLKFGIIRCKVIK